MPPPGGRGRGSGACSAQPPGGRGGGRGGATATFEVPISRRHFKAHNSRRGRARNSRRGRSGPGPSKGRLLCPPCQNHVAEQTPVSSSSKLLGTLKESSTTTTSSSTPQALLRDTTEISASSPSPEPAILLHEHPDWYLNFYIRIDSSEYYHTYPDVGGPFKSLPAAQNAIDCYLDGLQHETMRKESLDKLSPMDSLIQRALYWPDRTMRKYSDAAASENTHTQTCHLLKAVLDKYNDDHKLSADCAYELKDALNYQTMREGNTWYSHFNFTTKAKGDDVDDNLFFAEVMEGDEMTVTCFCMINTDANGCCYGCTNNGNVGMKHPSEANPYNAGHPDAYLLSEWTAERDVSDVLDDDEAVKTEVERLRRIYKGLDDPNYLKEISTSPYATDALIEE